MGKSRRGTCAAVCLRMRNRPCPPALALTLDRTLANVSLAARVVVPFLAFVGCSAGAIDGAIDGNRDDGGAQEDDVRPRGPTTEPGSDSGGSRDAVAAPTDSGTPGADSGSTPTEAGPSGETASDTASPGPGDAAPPPPPPPVDAGPPPPIGTPLTPGDPGPSDVRLTLRSDTATHAISPLIYGTNGARGLTTNHQTLVRSGGNRMTAYNWENNASNAGSDYCFQNDGLLSSSDTPGAAIKPVVEQIKAAGGTAIVTIPIVDYVAADKLGGCDVRSSGASYLTTRFKQNKSTKPTALSPSPDQSDAYVYQDEFVAWLKGAVPGANVIFSMDNEPDLWSSTHAEVHPTAVGYDELVNRNIDYAKAVKRAWPSAKVLGFVSYGFNGYISLQDAPDRAGKGEFTDYYLTKMKEAESAAGKRLVDHLDLHWYPEAQGGGTRIIGADTSAAVIAAREQAPRSLWDPSYSETSWVKDYVGGPIKLITSMSARIASHYPGTGLAFTEWNYGGGTDISGAIASADVLGIFGREGVAVASLWELNGDEHFTYAAFQAYRNFDGAGGAFGDTSMSAVSSDVPTATVYASYDLAKPNRVVVVAINKATAAKTAGITVAHPTSFKTAKVFTVTASGGAKPVSGVPLTAVAVNAFRYTMPAQSVTVIEPSP